MAVGTSTIMVHSKGENDMVDITCMVTEGIKGDISDGTVTIFISDSTAAVTTIEYEPGAEKGLSCNAWQDCT
jgi:thiamine phosphate synthase YjbQ (UPF0047 family)